MSENKKVKWYVVDKRLIKFHDGDKTYNVAEGVNVDGVEPKVDVVVEIKDSVVTSLTVAKAEDKKTEEKPKETEPQDCSEEKKAEEEVKKDAKEVLEAQKGKQKEVVETKKQEAPANKEEAPAKVEKEIKPVTWTISAISFDNAVVKFAEQKTEKYWYPITEKAIDAFKGLAKGDKIQIVIDEVDAESKAGEAYKKDGIVDAKAVVKKEEEKVEEKTSEEDAGVEEGTKEAYSSSTGNSIERQVALKEAGAIIRSLIDHGGEMANSEEKINALLSSFTKGSLKALRNA